MGIAIEIFYGKPNYKQKKIKSLQYPHKQIGLCTKGSFHESDQCNYIFKKIKIKILKVIMQSCLNCNKTNKFAL